MEGEFVPRYAGDREPPFCDEAPPKITEYVCDVLVVGGGFAGLMAAVTAAEAGQKTVLADKGKPGYSGQSPYAGCTRWFDEELGDDREAYENNFLRGSQYMGNLNWGKVWLDESKSIYLKMKELGLFEEIPRALESGHAQTRDFVGYREFTGAKDRHARFVPILKQAGVTVVERTMMCDVIREGGRVVGAVGLDVPSGTVVTFHAKAVILCMGGGAYKPAGYPACGLSYDATAIGYRLGLPIIGHEFEDYHMTSSGHPSNAFLPTVWDYLEPMCFLGGGMSKDHIFSTFRLSSMKLNTAINGSRAWGDPEPMGKRPPRPTPQANGPRVPRLIPPPVEPGGDSWGGSAGFGMHTVNGIYCGAEDTHGYTGIPGLYCAGDGSNAGPFGGSDYPGGPGCTSNFVSLQGRRAAQAASEYAGTVELEHIPLDCVEAVKKSILSPMERKTGFSPAWALDLLQGVMMPPWTIVLKTEECLKAALTQIEFLRNHILPKLQATSAHDLRCCVELQNKVLEAEMKLRMSLERKESRGGHYRMDYPYRDDENYLCYFAAVRGEDGTMHIERIEYPDAWKGDLAEPYEVRYADMPFPGENEARAEKGEGCRK